MDREGHLIAWDLVFIIPTLLIHDFEYIDRNEVNPDGLNLEFDRSCNCAVLQISFILIHKLG